MSVVDLYLFARLDLGAHDGHLVGGGLVGELEPHVAAEARDPDGKTVLVAQTLVHGRDGVGLEHPLDPLVVLVDGGVGEAAGPGVDQLGEPAPNERSPLGLG